MYGKLKFRVWVYVKDEFSNQPSYFDIFYKQRITSKPKQNAAKQMPLTLRQLAQSSGGDLINLPKRSVRSEVKW